MEMLTGMSKQNSNKWVKDHLISEPLNQITIKKWRNSKKFKGFITEKKIVDFSWEGAD